MLEHVENVWRRLMGYPALSEEGGDVAVNFMKFEDREQAGTLDDEDE